MASQLPGVVVGAILSLAVSVLVLYLQRRWRERGELHPEVTWIPGGSSVEKYFETKFHNKRDVGVSLWNIRLEFYKEGTRTACKLPTLAGESGTGPVGVLNLPSHIGISRTMEVKVGGDDDLRTVKEADKVEFVGDIPGGGELREELPPGPDSRPRGPIHLH